MKCKRCRRDIEANSIYCNWCGKKQIEDSEDAITVPAPSRLPSGKWRIQLRREGINIIRNTPELCTLDAQMARRQWQAEESVRPHRRQPKLTLYKCLDNYISAKSLVLSPTTIHGYENVRDFRFKSFMQQDVKDIDWQNAVNAEVRTGYKPKSIANAWGVVESSLRYAGIEFNSPTLPKRIPSERNWLTYEQIQEFVKRIEGDRCEMGALLALHSLRRSELFGLKVSNYDAASQTIHVRGAMLTTIGPYEYVDLNKTDTSRRDVPIIIPRLHDLLSEVPADQEFFIGDTQKRLHYHINKVCADNGLPEVGLHGLRHSFASLAYHLGWKKMTTQQIGGWKNSKVLDEIYTHNADLENDVNLMRDFYRE